MEKFYMEIKKELQGFLYWNKKKMDCLFVCFLFNSYI